MVGNDPNIKKAKQKNDLEHTAIFEFLIVALYKKRKTVVQNIIFLMFVF